MGCKKRNKWYSLLIFTIVFWVGSNNMPAVAQFAGGSATEVDPIFIETFFEYVQKGIASYHGLVYSEEPEGESIVFTISESR